MKGYILVILLLLTGCVGYNWDGAFPDTKITYIFLDRNNNPVQGVALEVLDDQGERSFDYPINQFHSEGSIVSNSDGVMEFGHISKRALEFGGDCTNFYFKKVGDCTVPVYTLKFTFKDKEIYSIPYNELSYLGEEITIKKTIYMN